MKKRKVQFTCGHPQPLGSQHTPTPWSYCYDGSSDWSIGEAADPQAKKICGIWDKNDARAEANAAFIVRAVNSHEKLLKALRRIVRDCDDTLAVMIAEEAIAKAEGK